MTAAASTDDANLVTREIFEQFIGPNAEKYADLWEKQKRGVATVGFFLMGLLALLPWLMYRKLYGYAAGFLLIPIAIAILFPDFSLKGSSGAAIGLSLSLVIKHVYIVTAENKIKKILARTSPGPDRDVQLNKAGGVSRAAGIIGGVIYAAQIAVVLLAEFQRSA